IHLPADRGELVGSAHLPPRERTVDPVGELAAAAEGDPPVQADSGGLRDDLREPRGRDRVRARDRVRVAAALEEDDALERARAAAADARPARDPTARAP